MYSPFPTLNFYKFLKYPIAEELALPHATLLHKEDFVRNEFLRCLILLLKILS